MSKKTYCGYCIHYSNCSLFGVYDIDGFIPLSINFNEETEEDMDCLKGMFFEEGNSSDCELYEEIDMTIEQGNCNDCLHKKSKECTQRGFDLGNDSFTPVFCKNESDYAFDVLTRFDTSASGRICFDYRKFQE